MLIKIISGIYGHNVNGSVKPKRASDEPFEVEDTEAARLISLGVAKAVDPVDVEAVQSSDNTSGEADDVEEQEADEEETDEESSESADEESRPNYSEETDIQELREIAKAYGVSFSPNIGKTKLIQKLDEFFEADSDSLDLAAGDPIV